MAGEIEGLHDLKSMETYLSPRLLKDTPGIKKRGEFLKRVVSNLKEMAFTKFHRFETGFLEGRWINNKSVLKSLENNVVVLACELQKTPEKIEGDTKQAIQTEIVIMRDICKTLLDSGAKEHAVKNMETNLGILEEVLNKPEKPAAHQERKSSEIEQKATERKPEEEKSTNETQIPKKESSEVQEKELPRRILKGKRHLKKESKESVEEVQEKELSRRKLKGKRQHKYEKNFPRSSERKTKTEVGTVAIPEGLEEKIKNRINKPTTEKEVKHAREPDVKPEEGVEKKTVAPIAKSNEREGIEEIKSQVQDSLNTLVKLAKEFGLTESLGQTMDKIGGWTGGVVKAEHSPQNRELASLLKADYQKMSIRKIFDNAVSILTLCEIGLIQNGIILQDSEDENKLIFPENAEKLKNAHREAMAAIETLIGEEKSS